MSVVCPRGIAARQFEDREINCMHTLWSYTSLGFAKNTPETPLAAAKGGG